VDLFLPSVSQVAVASTSVSSSSKLKKLSKSLISTVTGSFGSQVTFGWALSIPMEALEFLTASHPGMS
jgi:hypothetical protein